MAVVYPSIRPGTVAKWQELRDLYIKKNVNPANGTPYTFKLMATELHLNYTTLRQRAARERWNDSVADALDQRSSEALEVITAKGVVNECEIRTRHMRVSRLALSKAEERLNKLKPEDLSIKDTLELLRIGITEERRAAGLVDTVGLNVSGEVHTSSGAGFSLDSARDLLGQLVTHLRKPSRETYVQLPDNSSDAD